MVDEELLLQRGISLGLHRHEPTARRSIVSSLIASVTADAELVELDGAGHGFLAEKAAAANKAVLSFLRRHRAGPPK